MTTARTLSPPSTAASDLTGVTADPRARAWLLAIIAGCALMRIAHLVFVMRQPGFAWSDADGYMTVGWQMAQHGWHWDYAAVDYFQFVKAPLYPVVLSVFAIFPRYPLNAALFQIALQTVGGGCALFVIGRTMHSARAGLIAAAIGVGCLGVTADVAFMQENIAVPLVLVAVAWLLRAIQASWRPRLFAAVGAFFGVVALVRSMPVYFVPPAALLYIAVSTSRRAAWPRALAFVAGFAVAILPYSAFISARQGHVIVVDDQGSRALVMRDSPQKMTYVPGLGGSLRMLASDLVSAPAGFARERWSFLRATFVLRGVYNLQVTTPAARTRAGASMWKLFVHLTTDLPTALIALLAPFGFALARNRRASAMVLLWILVTLTLMNLFLWGSARYRASIESQMLVAAAVVLAGGWRRPRWPAVVVATFVCLILAIIVVPSIPRTASAQAPYGIEPWQDGDRGSATRLVGGGGFTVRRFEPDIRLRLTTPGAAEDCDVAVSIDGRELLQTRVAAGQPLLVHYAFPPRAFAYIEIRATGGRTGTPATVDLQLLQRRY